ncbi:PPC domain-containing DNA-binding protein [Hymenobacter sp. GOD-10R]|uniref:PPC domain-containing DNA-binding protein n=1 Tax=Hymenobacter sp. GOD-10R TaxID=3093922 RepID=UPI002D76D69B|nr:PPC domain-containing DNA-binding protein [Hymenobacter sp. GOD-10R]WRQ29468.1 PPC domain-containing DNA-binding protein [Hymenobacter sp. GOD-10R]
MDYTFGRPVHYYLLLLIWGLGSLAAPATVAQQKMPALPTPPVALSSPMRTYALRLRPGDDLRQQLTAFTQQHSIKAGAIVTCVGSLTTTTLRLANQEGPTVYQGHFEIVSLVGTLSVNGSHLHLSVADSTGHTLGGHLLDGNRIYTTAELVIGVLEELEFRRETDPVSTYQELSIYPAPSSQKPRRASPKKP